MDPSRTVASMLSWFDSMQNPELGWHQKQSIMSEYLRTQRRQNDLLSKQTRMELSGELQADMERIFDQELRRLRGEPTPEDMEQVADRIADRLGDLLYEQYHDHAREVYEEALGDVGSDIGMQLNFTDAHQDVLDTIAEGRGVADAFADFEDDVAEQFNELIAEAFREGEVDPQELYLRMKYEIQEAAQYKLERIARSETFKIYETARMEGYLDAEARRGEQFLYEFGPKHLGETSRGNPECQVCYECIERTQGGVPMEEMIDVIVEVSTDPEYGGDPNWDPMRDRNFPLPHPNCRHRHVRLVGETGSAFDLEEIQDTVRGRYA